MGNGFGTLSWSQALADPITVTWNLHEILGEVSAHIPEPHEKTTLFYGWYSNRTRGYRKRHGLSGKAETADPVPDTDDRVPLEVRRSWARLIRKVYEVGRSYVPAAAQA